LQYKFGTFLWHRCEILAITTSRFSKCIYWINDQPVVITVAIVGLALVTFPRWFMRVAHVVYGLGLVFALWLLSQSFFVINALCPWCLLVTGSTITVFSTITRVVLLENTWNFSPERQEKIVAFLDKGWGRVIYTGAYASILIAIFIKYGNKLFS